MLSSNFRSYKDIVVIDLMVSDLVTHNYTFYFLEQIEHFNKLKLVINLDCNSSVTSGDIHLLEKLVNAMQITGKKVCICGLNPINVAVLVNFAECFNFNTALNVERAIDALSAN